MASFKDYYDTLGVKKDAGQDEIRRAFRKLAAKHHPDRNPGDEGAEERFKEINEAYTALSDPEKRKIYDTYGRSGQAPPQGGWTGAPGGAPGGARVWTNVEGSEFDGFSDFFQSLFGGGVGGFGGFEEAGTVRSGRADPFADLRRGARTSAPPRSVTGDLDLELERAFHGGEVAISIGGRKVTVTVPPGVRPGGKLRLRGQAPGGGDLLLAVHIKPHPVFELEGDDVRVVARIPDHLAALGGTTTVPSLAGRIDVTVPPGSSSGRVLRLRGQGWPRKGGGRGDQLIELRVVVPEMPNEEQTRLYRRLRELADGPAEPTVEAEATAEGD